MTLREWLLREKISRYNAIWMVGVCGAWRKTENREGFPFDKNILLYECINSGDAEKVFGDFTVQGYMMTDQKKKMVVVLIPTDFPFRDELVKLDPLSNRSFDRLEKYRMAHPRKHDVLEGYPIK